MNNSRFVPGERGKEMMKKDKWVGNVPEHTQIIQFIGGIKKTIQCIIRIDEGELLRLTTTSGKEFLIDKSKVLWIERYIEREKNKEKKTEKKLKDSIKKIEDGPSMPITGYAWYGSWIEDKKDHGYVKRDKKRELSRFN